MKWPRSTLIVWAEVKPARSDRPLQRGADYAVGLVLALQRTRAIGENFRQSIGRLWGASARTKYGADVGREQAVPLPESIVSNSGSLTSRK